MPICPQQFQQALLAWFDQYGRKDLPWQQKITPYRVWVSEIMLQQTQVSAVIPYFLRFITSFPTVVELAQAPQDDVLAHWSGLGYYARARNLYRCAQIINDEYGGEFPQSVESLGSLPGIGRSTAGAIASISMGVPAAILDGNAKRVLARVHSVAGWPGTSAVSKRLWQLAEQYTPQQQRIADYTQAIMDLGATLCTRTKPSCGKCPLSSHCTAHSLGNPTDFPGKKPRTKKPLRQTTMLLIEAQGQIFLQQRPAQGIWGGLWSPPESSCAQTWLNNRNWLAHNIQPLSPLRHLFTHFQLDISPLWVQLEHIPKQLSETGSGWYPLDRFNRPRASQDLGLPAPVVKLIKQLLTALISSPNATQTAN